MSPTTVTYLKVHQTLERYIRPYFLEEGKDLKLTKISTDGQAHIELVNTLHLSQAEHAALKQVIENIVLSMVAEVKNVNVIS